jgi:hypothetical protein
MTPNLKSLHIFLCENVLYRLVNVLFYPKIKHCGEETQERGRDKASVGRV